MTGPEHYRKAEKLLRVVANSEDAPVTCAQLLAEAQVHAILAAAAASSAARNYNNAHLWETTFTEER